ncbi:MAG: hypothetical protein AAF798_09785 [Bacteroidota bacterium]
MGFLNEIKKLMFGAKSVAKSAGQKAVDKGKEVGGEIRDKSEELFDQAKDKVGDIGADVADKASTFFDNAKDVAQEVGSEIWEEAGKASQKAKEKVEGFFEPSEKEEDFLKDEVLSSKPEDPFDGEAPAPEAKPNPIVETASKVGQEFMDRTEGARKVMGDTAEKVGGKVLDTAEKVGGKVLDKAEEVGSKVMDVAEDVGGKVLEKTGDIWEKAKAFGGDLMDKANDMAEQAKEEADKFSMDETVEKAKQMGADLEDKVSSTASSTKESLLDGKDSFFERAQRFADGDYHNEGARRKEGELEIGQNPDYKGKAKKEGTVPGFEDLDGDGNEIIDDAIIDED